MASSFDRVGWRSSCLPGTGIPGKSNALAIAERLGLHGSVVDDARSLLDESSDISVEEVIGALQEQREEQRALNAELATLRTSVEAKQAALDARERSAAKAEGALRASVQRELEAELDAARATIADLVRRAQQGGAAGGKSALVEAQAASQDLARLKKGGLGGAGGSGTGGGVADAAAAAGGAKAVDVKAIAVGDLVGVPRLGEGLVEVETVKGNQLIVVYGGLKMKVKAKEVTQLAKPAPPPPPPAKRQARQGGMATKGGGGKGGGSGVAVRFASNTLDLRGQYAGEIDGQLGHAVDRAASIGTLFVIHGHGTGSLKRRVRELLAEEPLVKRVEDAPNNEGGAGCTIAYLK